MTGVRAQYGFLFDPGRCTGCGACVVACQLWNERPPSIAWRRVWQGVPATGMPAVSLSCLHCADPPCRHACPVRAPYKRASDGIVAVDASACIGCLFCALACPFGALQLGLDGKIEKCTYCADRAAGTPRACEEVCPHGAIVTGALDELRRLGTPARVPGHDGIAPSLVLAAGQRR